MNSHAENAWGGGRSVNLAHLYYFRKLVELNNYSMAAKELYIAQPTLSLAISNLEKELGTVLVKKKRGNLQLTVDGEDLYEAAVVATNAIDNATMLIRERGTNERGKVRIGTVYSIQSQAWSEAIRASRIKMNFNAQVAWRQGTTESLMHDLKNGSVDVIFAGLLQKNDPEIESVPSFTQSATLVVNALHPLANRQEVSLDELEGMPIITYRDKTGPFKDEIVRLFASHPQLCVNYEHNDEITLCSLVTADPKLVAVACHSWLVDSFPDVATVKIKEAPEDFHQFYISYAKKERTPALVNDFIGFMKDYDFDNASPRTDNEADIVVDFLK